MSDTPRTDAISFRWDTPKPGAREVVDAEDARQLERELAAAKKERDALWENNLQADTKIGELKALLQEWVDTEIDEMDEGFHQWIDSFTERVKAAIDKAMSEG